MRPHFAGCAKEAAEFAAAWSGGDDSPGLNEAETYAKTLRVRKEPEDGQLSLDEFKALMKDLPLSKEIDVELLFHQADTNKDGVLVFDEFVNCFERVTGSALAQ